MILNTNVSADFFLTAEVLCPQICGRTQTQQDLEIMQHRFASVLSVSLCSSCSGIKWQHVVTHKFIEDVCVPLKSVMVNYTYKKKKSGDKNAKYLNIHFSVNDLQKLVMPDLEVPPVCTSIGSFIFWLEGVKINNLNLLTPACI